MSSSPHALVLPLPFLSHITSLMHLSRLLTNHDFIITFVNTEHNQHIVSSNKDSHPDQIRMISIPDGLSLEEERNNYKLFLALEKHMPARLEQVICEINEREEEKKITCLIADCGMTWAFEIAEKMGLQTVAFCPTSGTHVAVACLSIPKLIKDGIIDENGFPKNQEKFRLTATTPLMDLSQLTWNYFRDHDAQRFMFHYFVKIEKALSKAQFILINSCEDLELPIFTNFPNLRPIGPLIEQVEKIGTQIGQFSDNTTCMTWLDQQENNSVVYVSFGSVAKLDQNQLEELGLGLELSQMPFLWIIRRDLTDSNNNIFLQQFEERVKQRGKIAKWCNQKKVLAHPSVTCFVSHCGWNSTIEGVTNGLRFLCWPYFADQFANQDYICDMANIGLRVVKNENGVVTKENIQSSLIELMENNEMKERAEKLKEIVNKSTVEGGSSFTNLNKFVQAIKK
ncbi:hypothetical protein LUZ60_011722 [Juncus effusus]|nr:hypothetical protein LUZ60_011722 [Juncus effusus]